MTNQTIPVDYESSTKPNLIEHAILLSIVCIIGLIANTVATDNSVIDGFIGLFCIYIISMIGLAITYVSPIKLPSVAWISLVGIIATLPWTPGSEWVIDKVSHVNFLTLATPCLAYAGLAIARSEIVIAKTSGWKLFIVSVMVMTGTYIGSAFVADLFL